MRLKKTIDETIAAFSEKAILESVNIYRSLALLGYTMHDLDVRNQKIVAQQRSFQIEDDKFLKEQQLQAEKDREAYNRIAPKCPDCDLPLMLKGISIPQGKGNKNDYKSLLYCNGPTCLYEKYSGKPADYLYRQMVKKAKKEKANGS